MAWRYIGQNSNIKLFLVAGELKILTTNFIEFVFNISPGIYLLLVFSVIALYILYLLFYISRVIAREDI